MIAQISRLGRRSRALLVAVGALALLAGPVVVPAAAAPGGVTLPGAVQADPGDVPPQDDPFYAPPDPLPDVPAGSVIRSRPVPITSYGFFPEPVDAWQILYRSTSALGEPNAVAGTLLVPQTEWTGSGPRPVVTYAVGTHGLGPECAPSYLLATGQENELNIFRNALQRGWAVVVTDYEGMGTPGTHTYVAGRAEGHAMLDAARAAQSLPEAGLAADAPVGIWGYSQGGHATAWAAQLEATYAPELNVAGSAVGAAPADLENVARLHDGGPASVLVLMAAVGLATAYPDAPFEEILTEEGKTAVAEASEMCVEEAAVPYAFKRLADYTTVEDPIAMPEWQTILEQQRLGGTAPAAPALIYHAPLDELIPITEGVALQEAWCAGGATVQFQPLVAGEHVIGAVAGAPYAVQFLGSRFAGDDVLTTCSN